MTRAQHFDHEGRLKAARKALGLTDRQMAAAVGLSGANAKDDLRKMEDGLRPVTGPVLVAAEALVKLREFEDWDFKDTVRELADMDMTHETPGVAADPLGDQLVQLARQWMKVHA